MATVTPTQFLAGHPDLKTWMPADYESYEVLAESTGKTPKPVSTDWRHALKDNARIVTPSPAPAA